MEFELLLTHLLLSKDTRLSLCTTMFHEKINACSFNVNTFIVEDRIQDRICDTVISAPVLF